MYGDGYIVTRRLGRLAALGPILLAAIVSTGISSRTDDRPHAVAPARVAAVALAGKVIVVVSLNSSRRGRFSARGSISDSGSVRGRQTVSANRARLTLTLRGEDGTITLLVSQVCGRVKSAWKALSGSGAYQGISGGGVGKGHLGCGRRTPHRSVYTGFVRTPPPPLLAQPGIYRGTGFNPNLRVTFEVLPDGRTVTHLSFRQVVARCQPPAVAFLEPEFSGRYPIDADGSFSIAADGYVVSGKLSPGRAKGALAVDARGCKAGPLSWTATTPPTPLPAVPTGRYCGFTLAGPGICLDATQDAWVTRVLLGPIVRCFEPEAKSFKLEYTYEGAIAIHPDLTFEASLADVPLEGGGSMRWSVSGKFDGLGEATGRGGFSRVSIVREGTLYKCRNAISAWSVKRGA